MAIELKITSSASLGDVVRAQKELENLANAGDSANKIFRNTKELRAFGAAIDRNYNITSYSKKETQAMTVATNDYKRALDILSQRMGDGEEFKLPTGEMTKDFQTAAAYLSGEYDKILKTHNERMALMAKRGDDVTFSYEGLHKQLERNGNELGLFGSEAEVIQMKMARIKEEGLNLAKIHGTESEEVQKLSKDYQHLAQELDKVSASANGTGQRIKNLVKNFVSAQLVVWAIRRTFQLLTKGVKDSIDAVANLEQAFSRFEAVYDNLERANQAVLRISESFGIARSTAAEAMAEVGGIAVGFDASTKEAAEFAEKVVGSLSDIMAFRDVSGSIGDFAQRFMAGAAGSVQNFRTIGSVVRASMVDLELQRQGWENLTGISLEWAKMQARVNIVLEQQRKAVGATKREWDTLLSISRRHKESSKELKEIIGEDIAAVYKPVSEWILKIKEDWVAAARARDQYNKGTHEILDIPEAEFAESAAFRSMWSNMRKEYINAAQGTGNAGIWDMRERTGYSGIHGLGPLAETGFDELERWAISYGQTMEYVIRIAEEVGLVISEETKKQATEYDKAFNIAKNLADTSRKSAEDAAEAAEQQGLFLEQVGALAKMGAPATASISSLFPWLGKDASEFVSPIDMLLGLGDDKKTQLQAKADAFSEMIEYLYNQSMSNTSSVVRAIAEAMLGVVVEGLSDVNDEIKRIDVDTELEKTRKGLLGNIKALEMQHYFAGIYQDTQSEIGDILFAQWQAEQEMLTLAEAQNWTEAERLEMMGLISDEYALQLNYARRQIRLSAEQQREEAKKRAGTSAMDAILGVRRERSYIGVSDAEKMALDIQYAAEDLAKTLLEAGGDEADVRNYVNRYRLEREMLAADELAEEQRKIADELTEATKQEWEDLIHSIGDVGLVMDVIETGLLGWAKLVLELVNNMENLQRILNIISDLFEKIGPFIDQIFAPLMPALDTFAQIIADLLVPALQILFPIIKLVTFALIPLLAVVRTVTNAISWMGSTIETFIWNLIHPFKKREYRNLADETAEIWQDALSQMEEIDNLELKVRLDFINELTDAQKGELQAYEEMYKSGLLTLTEFQAMVGKNVYGKNFDNVIIPSFAKGGEFITAGEQIIRVGEAGAEHVKITPLDSRYATSTSYGSNYSNYTVVVNGATADPEAIALAVRREFSLMERRGVKYA